MSIKAQLITQNEEIAAKQAALAELLKGVDELSGTKAADRRDEILTANAELADLGKERDETDKLAKIEEANQEAMKSMRQPVGRQIMPESEGVDDPLDTAIKNFGDLLRGNTEYQAAIKSGRKFRGELGEIAYKALLTSSAQTPQAQRLSPVLSAQEERVVADLMLQGTTQAQRIEYYEENSLTNAAAAVAEGDPKPESAMGFTLRGDDVRKIATWVPVTDEALQDVEGFESYIRERLGFMVRRREESQLLSGSGTAPEIRGILNRSGLQTQAIGTDNRLDAVYKAITKVRAVAFAEPTGIVMHPNDWADVRLMREDGTTGGYLFGPPSQAGEDRLWGLEVRITTAMTEGTALVGAFRPHAQVFRKDGIEIAVSSEHSDYFVRNQLAVRAEERLALAVYRPAAFCTVTGI